MYDLSVSTARNPLIAITVFIAIAIVTTAIRLQAKKMIKISISLEDYFMLAALFFLLVSVGIEFACVLAGGVGRHVEAVDPLDTVKTLKLILPFEALYGITLCFIKVSVVTFYLRIFGAARNFRLMAFIAIGILIAWATSVVLETFLLCRPLSFNWDTTVNGVCGDRNTVYVSAGALNVVTDFMVMGLPIPHIIALQLPARKKIGLIFMFSLGLFITIISIVRIKSLQAISFTDPTFTLPMGLFWTTLEPCLCIINSNLPMCRNFLVVKYPALFGSTKGSFAYGTSGTGRPTGRQRTVNGAYGEEARTRPDNFEMLGEEFDEGKLRGDGRKNGVLNTITAGKSRRDISPDEESMESQTELTRDVKGGRIMVGRTVDVERYDN